MRNYSYQTVNSIINFAIIFKRKRKLVASLLLSYRFIITINVLWVFLTVPWVGMQYVIVIFLDHTHFLFSIINTFEKKMVNIHLKKYRSTHHIGFTSLFEDYMCS